ncbi:hypothetical protein [Paenibacillus terrigena]|uniref:hypothetical protein n=1 Tax=Paenibacillus terrigena TaxID=369333 RepID=UPI0012EC72E5|nr:hypothetical protein [Paenibacillus terrigena]
MGHSFLSNISPSIAYNVIISTNPSGLRRIAPGLTDLASQGCSPILLPSLPLLANQGRSRSVDTLLRGT